MNPRPTGRIQGKDLVLTRSFRAPIDDVWASITESDRTERWFGKWVGEPGEGNTIRVKMTFEKGDAWADAVINTCRAPSHLVVTTLGDYGSRLDIMLVQTGDTTEMTFKHCDVDLKAAGEYGPGWEYYLDNLVASRDGTPLPSFDDYYPSQKQYFLDQAPS